MVDPPTTSDATALADWAEQLLLVERGTEVTRARLTNLLARDEGEEEEPEPDEPDEELDEPDVEDTVANDARIDLLVAEIARRRRIAPRVYAFAVDDEVVRTAAVAAPAIYRFLLWLSIKGAPFRKQERHSEAEQPFDALARTALEIYFGPRSRAVLFARRYARDPATDTQRPTSFPEAIKWLRDRLDLGPNHQAPPEAVPEDWEGDLPRRTYQDGGVDVVVWRHFRDARSGFPILLAQCTIQIEWRPKTRDVSLTLWSDWIRFVATPQKALVIPFAVPDNKSWWEARNRAAGVIVDRLRLCELLDELPRRRLRTLLHGDTSNWLRREIALFAGA